MNAHMFGVAPLQYEMDRRVFGIDLWNMEMYSRKIGTRTRKSGIVCRKNELGAPMLPVEQAQEEAAHARVRVAHAHD